jgi:acetoin utilization protein AcuC
MNNILIYSHELAVAEYETAHPFKPFRAKIFHELLKRYYLIFEPNQKVLEPKPLDEELLYLFHTREYIELLKKGAKGEFTTEMLSAGLGTGDNPIFPSMYTLPLHAAGGTQMGATLLLNNEARFVFNPIGGFHHAGKDHASGFCYINDIAVSITDLIRKGQRIAYIDIDAHHGNGVQDAFYDTDRVLKISFHESGETLYPGSGFEFEVGAGRGRGYNVNVPLNAETDDEVYLYAFESVVPLLIESFKPDIVFAVIGGDTHRTDPLAHLNLTSNGYSALVGIINDISPKILAMGAGGYNVFKTAALWTLAWARFCGLKPQDQYAGLIGGLMYGPETEAGNLDDEPYVLDGGTKDLCLRQARRVVDFIKEQIFPIHGIRP